MNLQDKHIISAISYFLENDIPISTKLLEYVDNIRKVPIKEKVDSLIKDMDYSIDKIENHDMSTHINVRLYLEQIKSYKKDLQDLKEFFSEIKIPLF
jgi:hypothetical protein